tara:strand:+ start:5037 stop:5897 length:861 start_codon:yes stop_codon:yes gene_type:complete
MGYSANLFLLMPKSSYDSDALAFISAHEAATGLSMGTVQKTAINNRYLRYKGIIANPNSSNLWSLINGTNTRMWIFCPIDDTTSNSSAYNIDFVSKTSLGTFTNFVSGDFSVNGVVGGATKYFESSLSPNNYSQDNVGYYAYIRADASLASSIMGANDAANANRTALISDLGSGFRSYINNTALPTDAAVTVIRLIGTQRGVSTTLESVKDGVVVKTEALTSVTPTTRPLYWFSRSNNGVLNNVYNNGQLASLYQGLPYLTTNQLSDFYWIEQLYQTEVITGGRQV